MPLSTTEVPANYRLVLEVINDLGPGRHASAQDVYAQARARKRTLGFTTVHRALGRLCDLGLILKLDIPGESSAVYESAASPHAHFRCTVCGTIADVDFALSTAERTALGTRHGFAINTATVTLSGTCNGCCP